MKTFIISCVKQSRSVTCSLEDAIDIAWAMEDELQPAYGVTVEDEDGNIYYREE